MSENFSKLFSLEKNLYAEGVPIIIKEGVLLKNNDNGKLVIQLQMLNICKQPIKAVKLKIIGCDTFEQQVYTQEFQYIDMIAQSNSDFGNQTMLDIDNQTVRSFTVELVQVLFDDKMSWYGKGEKFVHISDDITVEEYLYNVKNDMYERALNLYSLIGTEYILKAKSIFEELGDFKDSSKRVKDCDDKINKIAEEKREQEERNAELEEQTRIADEKKKAKIKKIGIATGSAIVLCVLAIILVSNIIIPTVRYNKAVELYKKGEYLEALQTIKYINKCNDSENIVKECLLEVNTGSITNKVIFINLHNVVAVQSNGTVITYQGERNNTFNKCDVSNWTDIIAISCIDAWNGITIVGLKSDGTVVVTGENSEIYNLDISNWTDIVGISVSESYHIVGLKSNGTVVATGNNNDGQCDISEWNNIISVSAKYRYTAGLKANSKMVATGSNETGKCNISEWRNIKNFAMGVDYTIGIQSDGTIVKVGSNYKIDEIGDWNDIVNIWIDKNYTLNKDWDIIVGLKSDGTVNALDTDNISTWTDIIGVWTIDFDIIGLKSDGTFITKNSLYDSNLSDFTDIKITVD